MKFINNIACEGILEKSQFKDIKCCDCFKQIMINDVFEIPPKKPDIESIAAIYINSIITNKKMISAIDSKKIIFHGILNIKVIYVANNPEQSVHSADFNQHFYSFLNHYKDCDDHCDENCDFYNVNSYIEDIEPVLINKRKFNLTTLILNCLKCFKECNINKKCE